MAFDGPLAEAEVHACVAALRTATAGLELLSPRALSVLARAAACFVREAKRLRRRRVRGSTRMAVAASGGGERPVPGVADFRSPAWVEAFAGHIAASVGRLDILINNAAQTVRRPAPFYAPLVPAERMPGPEQTAPGARLLAAGREFLHQQTITPTGNMGGPLPGALSAMLSQVPVLPEDIATLAAEAGIVATDDGIRDLRASNSWMLRLGEVATAECLEVLLVNAAAPFVLAGRLRELMARDVLADKWIVNVAAVEGQCSRRQKDARHPHLNMAKAALNMLTRSAAADYARDRIYMNSVDVGWFSNGEPAAVADAMRGRGFTLPLDVVDAAARVCDPIFSGVRTGTNVHGKLLKDYCPVEW